MRMGLFGHRELQLCGAHVSGSSIGLGVEADGVLEQYESNQNLETPRIRAQRTQPMAIRRGWRSQSSAHVLIARPLLQSLERGL